MRSSHTSGHHANTSGHSRHLANEVRPQGPCEQVRKYPNMLSIFKGNWAHEEPRGRGKNNLHTCPASQPQPRPGESSPRSGHRPLESFTPTAASHLQMPQTWGLSTGSPLSLLLPRPAYFITIQGFYQNLSNCISLQNRRMQ